jgi:ATP-dependent phosphoenolpyruvate carboxykinase
VFGLRAIGATIDEDLPPVSVVFVLVRRFGVLPAVGRLSAPEAAALFLVRDFGREPGATHGHESLTGSPHPSPLAAEYARQGNRLVELLAQQQAQLYLLHTGGVGLDVDADKPAARAEGISRAKAIAAAVVEGEIEFRYEPRLGFEVSAGDAGPADPDALHPWRRLERAGRGGEYWRQVQRQNVLWQGYLSGLPGLREAILGALPVE